MVLLVVLVYPNDLARLMCNSCVSPAFHSFHPYTRVCLDPGCHTQLLANPNMLQDRELVEELRYAVTVFTREFGAVPGYATSQYCRSKWQHTTPLWYTTNSYHTCQDVTLDITPITTFKRIRLIKTWIGPTTLMSLSSSIYRSAFSWRKNCASCSQI